MSSELDREEGIKAIIALQEFAGIVETREQAEEGWEGMSDDERRQTITAHKLLCGYDGAE